LSATLPKPERLRQQGFTLLELLLALTLLALLTSTLYFSYFTLFRGRESSLAAMDSRRELRGTMDQLRRELSSVLYRRGDKRLHFVVEDRDLFGKPASSLSFTAVAPPEAGGMAVSDQVELRYAIVEQSGRMVLSRQAKDIHAPGDPLRYPQIERVEGFLVECLSGNKWVRSWGTAINMNLPGAVRVTIRILEDDKPAEYSVIATPRINLP